MLQHLTGCVTNWLTAAGLPTGFVPTGPAFNDADIMLDAAELGIGVALCRLSLAFPRLDAGRLILASDTIVPSPLANLMIVRHECRELPAVQRFTRWLLPEARKIGDMIKAFDNA
jgi:LysR family glycine cleavage system transcriptional activator